LLVRNARYEFGTTSLALDRYRSLLKPARARRRSSTRWRRISRFII
jgi:hypothetical protein